jgi:hypothetical protein
MHKDGISLNMRTLPLESARLVVTRQAEADGRPSGMFEAKARVTAFRLTLNEIEFLRSLESIS